MYRFLCSTVDLYLCGINQVSFSATLSKIQYPYHLIHLALLTAFSTLIAVPTYVTFPTLAITMLFSIARIAIFVMLERLFLDRCGLI